MMASLLKITSLKLGSLQIFMKERIAMKSQVEVDKKDEIVVQVVSNEDVHIYHPSTGSWEGANH